MEDHNFLYYLIDHGDAVTSLLAFLVSALSGVVVYQWLHTMKHTVPKWVWDRLVDKIDQILKTQDTTLTIIKERLSNRQ
jgi:hypothetical protein